MGNPNDSTEVVDLSTLDESDLIPSRNAVASTALRRESVEEIAVIDTRTVKRGRAPGDEPHLRVTNPAIWSPHIPGLDDDDDDSACEVL